MALNNQRVCLGIIATTLLAGCGDRSVSGTYVSYNANTASLLQITQTPDHRFTGTLRRAILNSDGNVASTAVNVSGSADNGTIVLTVAETPLPIGQNVSGTVSGSGLDFVVPASQGSQTATVHFNRGGTSDYDAQVARLTAAGAPIIAQRQRAERQQAVNADVQHLTQDLHNFAGWARNIVAKTPMLVQFYDAAVSTETYKLEQAQSLAKGSAFQQGQAQFLQGQMQFDQAKVRNADQAIANGTNTAADGERTLNAHIERYTANCLGDGSGVHSGDLIPDMGYCKALVLAVREYHDALPPLHKALSDAGAAKASGDAKLAGLWKTAENLR